MNSAYPFRMSFVLLLTGPAGRGKTTVSQRIAETAGWSRVSEDEIWPALFGKDRGAIGSDEHRRKRAAVHARVFDRVLHSIAAGREVVIDATVHEAPPESFQEYGSFFTAHAVRWCVRVLVPRVEVAIARDAARQCWHLGAANVTRLHAKFTGRVFGVEAVIDNSDETADETAARVLASIAPVRSDPLEMANVQRRVMQSGSGVVKSARGAEGRSEVT